MSGTDRRWLELSARSPAAGDRTPLLVEGLLALGGRAAEERDGWYVTYLEPPDDVESFLEHAAATLRTFVLDEAIELRTGWKDHEEWAETWKRGLGARAITDRIMVRPSWVQPPPEAGEIDIVIDPGMAFGTAEHGTTRGCLRLLDGAVTVGKRILDVGAGSGILAIAAARLGAAEVVAIEGDTLAYEALCANVERNRVADRVQCVEALVDAESVVGYGPAHGVVANIESGVLSELMPGLARALDPGGWLILSGIQVHAWATVREAARRAGLTVGEIDADGEWRSGLFVAAPPTRAGS